VVLSVLLVGERPTWHVGLGSALVALGAILVSLPMITHHAHGGVPALVELSLHLGELVGRPPHEHERAVLRELQRGAVSEAGKITTELAASIESYLAGLLACTETLPRP